MQNEDEEMYVCNEIVLNSDISESKSSISVDSIERDFIAPELNTSNENEAAENFDILREIYPEMSQTNTSSEDVIELPPQRRCVSHLLNSLSSDFEKLLNQTARAALKASVNKANCLWTTTHRSSRAKTLCSEMLDCLLQFPCVTRWNSRYDALAKLCEPKVKTNVNKLIEKLKLELVCGAAHLQSLTNADWIVLNEYVRVMKPIAKSLLTILNESKRRYFHTKLLLSHR